MKRVLIFIGLKVVEIIGGLLLLTGLFGTAWALAWCMEQEITNVILLWVFGILMAGIVIFCIVWLIVYIVRWLKWNWKKAGEIAERSKNKSS